MYQYINGNIVSMNIIEIMVPKQITVPIGHQSGLLLMIIGITPIDAAAEVKNIGRIRRFPASIQASMTE